MRSVWKPRDRRALSSKSGRTWWRGVGRLRDAIRRTTRELCVGKLLLTRAGLIH